ncbi:MAG: leucyl/phenylalanyl-tRNA--protein transferase [Gammaproteobacteria bacterium]|nr:leucyl/phenylalanyl-tRNA--protein transferase [Gammaproteobacteria bacterium]
MTLLDDTLCFPAVTQALQEPDGLLAFGGDLSPERLLSAYRQGIFPWYNEGEPILWWSPDPRTVLFPNQLKVSRSLGKSLRNKVIEISFNQSFNAVIQACSEPRPGQNGTWINSAMIEAYAQLHKLGHAHSVEVWQQGQLIGGLYGIHIGQVFFGESMFSRQSDASKIALVHLVRYFNQGELELIDCQVGSAHLSRLGASVIPRSRFIQYLEQYC